MVFNFRELLTDANTNGYANPRDFMGARYNAIHKNHARMQTDNQLIAPRHGSQMLSQNVISQYPNPANASGNGTPITTPLQVHSAKTGLPYDKTIPFYSSLSQIAEANSQ